MATRSRPPSQPAPLSIRESWDPSFRQPPLSLAKYLLSGSSAFSGGSNPKSPHRADPLGANQTVNTVKDGLAQLQQSRGPHTPEEQKPPAVKETPRAAPKVEPFGKTQPSLGAPAPTSPQGPLGATPSPFLTPIPPLPSLLDRLQPPKDLHQRLQDRFGGQAMANPHVGLGLPQPEAVPFGPGGPQLPSHEYGGSSWGLGPSPLGPTRVPSRAHPNPAERKITSLTQSGTCAKYITKFCTLQMELDWNDAALRGQFARGLHWEVRKQIATRERQPRTLRELQDAALIIDNALRKERASHPQQGNKSGKTSSTPTGGRVPANRPPKPALSPPTPITSRRTNVTAAAQKVSVSNAANQGTSLPSAGPDGRRPRRRIRGKPRKPPRLAKTLSTSREKSKGTCCARKDPKDSGLALEFSREKAETIEVLIDSGATSSFLHPRTVESLRLPLIDLPLPRTVTMLNGSSPQAGKIWKKAVLTFTYDGKKMTETFLICNTGNHAAILGLKWLDAHNPEIDWNTRTLSFPHTPPEHVAIAEEEEADQNPLEGVPSKYHQYAKVFGEEEFNQLPPHRHYDIGIKLTEEGPLNSPLYSMTNAKSATLKDWLRDKLKAGKIRPSKSSISSPVMFNVYPLPRPDDLMAQLRGAKVFTKLDLRWGYNNVRVKEGDKWKTAFRTKYGLYESLVMTFGLTNAPAAFQHFMNKLFKDLLDVCVIIYLDDILIYSKDDATHTQHVHEVLQRLMNNQLFCKASKCTFHVTSVEYLGIIVSDKGFSLDKLKIQAVQEWPTPTKVKEVQLFLGFANFLRRFVANFSHMARPLHNLVKKDVPWRWDTREQEAFQGLKDAITNAPVLCHADPSKPYFLETDASGAALGSILSQRQEDGRLHPLGFLHCTSHHRLHGSPQPGVLEGVPYIQPTSRQMASTTSRIQLPDCIPSGETIREARRTLTPIGPCRYTTANQTMLPNPVFANVALVTPEKELQRQIEASLDQDESLEEILQFLQNKSKAPPTIKQAFKDYQMEAGLLFYQGRIVVPDTGTLRTDLLRIFHDSPLAGHPAPELADLFLQHVWKKYRMPKKTVSDRGRVFNNKFLKALYKRLGIDPHFSSAYHPQSNGQTERVNPTVEHFLRAYSGINQKGWVKWLPMAEFAYNNAVHSSTSKSPFKALHGWEPSLTPSNVPTDVPKADDIASQMESQWREIEAALRQSKTRMTAGEAGEPISFEEGEEAWLDARNVKLKTLSPKLTEQRLGPFKITEKISDRHTA
ncbi:hypothetical protein RHS01_09192 [Rhizoctonia solani]|uniref:Integrase catalytic domain-containing protein n=1 Tax=Rhizoctonia solani TaxID=456999 RepID=A0A8H7I9T9_9AGAM|nr:hypothetical protein RHS01_09192 [Rhizoctonia solani]